MIDKKYFDFAGLATRSEYWGVTVVNFLVMMVVVLIGVVIAMAGSVAAFIGGLVIIAACIAGTWVGYAVIARRCRDAGINPWFTLTVLIPYIGFIAFIVFGCLSTVKPEEVNA
jgi:uncharacterized membrane protein YhaH (DUF805 family)